MFLFYNSLVFCILGAFEDPDIIHVDDSVDPVRDLEVITEELRLKVYVIFDKLELFVERSSISYILCALFFSVTYDHATKHN